MTAFLGETRVFAFSFAPEGWAPCQGQLLSIPEYEPLFQLIGTTYGGDGVDTFALPSAKGPVSGGEVSLQLCISVFGGFPQQ